MSGRLAYLLKKFPRLSETFVLNEILEQEALGRDVIVFSRRAPDDEPRHPQLERLRATVEVLPPRREIDPWKTLFLEDWEDPEALFAATGRLVRYAADWGHPRFPSLLVEALSLLRRLRAEGVSHVHAHFATDSAIVAMMIHALGGPTYSVTAHAKDIYRSTVDDRLLERMFADSEFVVTVCDANVAALRSRLSGVAMAKVRRLYNGIDLDAFGFVDGQRERHHVLAVGRLVEKKGFHVLLDALAILQARNVPFRATIVGQGELEDALREQVASSGLEGRVTLRGALDQGAVRGLMRSATLFCLPCIIGEDGNRDALPTVLLEALASGLPCVSTDVTGVPEILGCGEAGAIVAQNDPLGLADAVETLFADPTIRAHYAEAGRARAKEHFDGKRVAKQLSTWFEEALTRSAERCVSSP